MTDYATLADLEDETRSFLTVGYGASFKEGDLRDHINNALREHVISADWWYFVTSEEIVISQSSPKIPFSEFSHNVRNVVRVTRKAGTGAWPLEAMSVRDVDILQQTENVPCGYTVEAQAIRIAPIPDADYRIIVYYQYAPSKMVNKTDSSGVPEQFSNIVVELAGVNALSAKGGMSDQAGLLLTRYRQTLANMRESEERVQREAPQKSLSSSGNPLAGMWHDYGHF